MESTSDSSDSLTLPHPDTQPTAVSARPESAGKVGSLPLRARLSQWRQRIILTLRWWFRLPIDDLKEYQTKAQFDAILNVVEQQAKAINQMINALNGLTARLLLYEREIPRIRDLRRQFDLEQAGIKARQTNGHAHENGILTLPEHRIIRP